MTFLRIIELVTGTMASSGGPGTSSVGTKRGHCGGARPKEPISNRAREVVPCERVPIILRGGFRAISGLEFQGQNLPKGRDLIPNLLNVQEVRHSGEETVKISGQIIRETNISEPPWNITFIVRMTDRTVIRANCTCYPGRSAKCKHAAAMFLFINEERSEGKTDAQQQWTAPSEKLMSLFPKGKTVQQIFEKGPKKVDKRRKDPEIQKTREMPPDRLESVRQVRVQKENEESCAQIVRDLEKIGLKSCSLYKSLSADTTVVPQLVEQPTEVHPEICEMFFKPGLQKGTVRAPKGNLDGFYFSHVICDDEERLSIFKKTMGQSVNKEWFREKKNRMSASVSRQLAFARTPETLKGHYFRAPFDTENLRYGRMTEPKAKEAYSKKYGRVVHESGLVVSQNYPWLCASPDGIVIVDNEIVVIEIKCPVSGQEGPIQVDYIKDGFLKRSHKYFAQVQVQMFCCNAKECHFFLYGHYDDVLIKIKRDDEFC